MRVWGGKGGGFGGREARESEWVSRVWNGKGLAVVVMSLSKYLASRGRLYARDTRSAFVIELSFGEWGWDGL